MGKQFDIIILSGGFDPLEHRHLKMINAAAQVGWKVFIGLNSDGWLLEKKGEAKLPYSQRCYALESLENVHEVVDFDDSDGTACHLIMDINKRYPLKDIAFGNGGGWNASNTPEVDICTKLGISQVWGLGNARD